MDKNLAELIGIMCGDGCLSAPLSPSQTGRKYYVHINGNSKTNMEHLKYTKKLLRNIYNKNVQVKVRKDSNTAYIKFSDKVIFNKLKNLELPVGKKYNSLKIPKKIKENTKLFKAFVRGLFDTDGCVVISKQHKEIRYYPRIEITSKNKGFLEETMKELKHLGFYGSISVKSGCWRMELPGFKNMELWKSSIGTKNLNNHIKMSKF